MSNFPLYENLSKDILKKDLTVKQKEEFIKKIENIDTTGRDLMFALIQFYRLETGDENMMNIPYNGTSVDNIKNTVNLTWSLTDFPIKLRYILYKFIILHTNSMKEEEARKDHLK